MILLLWQNGYMALINPHYFFEWKVDRMINVKTAYKLIKELIFDFKCLKIKLK
jgi:hypothetical protein